MRSSQVRSESHRDTVLPRSPEDLVLLTNNDALRQRFTSSLTPPRFRWTNVDFHLDDKDVTDATRFRSIFSGQATSIFLDCCYPSGTAQAFQELSARGPSELRTALENRSGPASIYLLSTLHSIRQDLALDNILLFFLIERTSTALSHALLRMGADWFWSPREDPQKVGDVISTLRGLQDEVLGPEATNLPPARGRVFVAENSRNVCLALRTRLGRAFTLEFVGEDKPGNRFDISTDEAIGTFSRGFESGGFVAAIIDLALSDDSEDQAKQRFASDEAASRTFFQKNRRLIRDIFGGVRIIEGIRRLAPKLPIFVFSNYIHLPTVDSIITKLVGRDIWASVETIEKSEKGYRQLSEELLRLTEEHRPTALNENTVRETSK